MTAPTLTVDTDAIRLSGRLLTPFLGPLERPVADLPARAGPVLLDLSGIETLDTGGAWLITDLQRRLEAAGAQVTITGLGPAHQALMQTVAAAIPAETSPETPPHGFLPWLEALGMDTAGAFGRVKSLVGFLGLTLDRMTRTLLRPWRLRWPSLVTQMEEAGFKAIPIVTLMGFLIGVVLAFQGSSQLRQFGAEIFVVDLISISVLRELGVLLTAILVAGRSGSAYTASIGSMKVQEELDAMQTLGLDPIDVLVVPRTLALVLTLPALAFLSAMAGLLGGALMSWIVLGISPGLFMERLQENTGIWHLMVGLIKAPFFAMVIGVISCWQAMQVRGSAQSVGQRTTMAVVQSTFAVIALDALFSILFAELGI